MRNGLTPALATACLALASASTAWGQIELEIFSDNFDGYIETRATGGPWPAVHPSFDGTGDQAFFLNIGEWFGDGLTSGIMPFQLPDLGDITDPFLTADLGVHLFEIGTATVSNVDLYGLRTASTPDLLASDYYSGTAADPTPGVVLLQEDFMTPSSQPAFPAEPNIFTSPAGETALVNYLNDVYNNGGAGDFVFLRLSYAADGFAAGFDAYKITSRNAGGGEGDFPLLTLTAAAVAGDTNNNGVVEFEPDFGPIRDNWLETNDSFGSVLSRTDGDLDANGEVSIEDFREWKDAFLAGGGSNAEVAFAFSQLNVAVPEPTGMLIAAALTLGAATQRRRTF